MNFRDSVPSTRPNELCLTIELPLLVSHPSSIQRYMMHFITVNDLCMIIKLQQDSATGLDLDVFETYVTLKHQDPEYSLKATLPYPVDCDDGTAKFDKSKKCLIVTLPVLPSNNVDDSAVVYTVQIITIITATILITSLYSYIVF